MYLALCLFNFTVIMPLFLQAIDTFKNPESDFKQICSELAEVEISPDEIELVFFHTANYV